MGFLDHSTNNIIIDAVLTDYGRQRLAQNNGQFKIEFFSLGDDEVDYGIIKKYGRPVGKEKIIKNTPIFEAQTRANSAIKSRMLTLANPSIFQMSHLTLETDNTSNVVTLDNTVSSGAVVSKVITVRQKVGESNDVPIELTDTTFTVYMNDRFVFIPNGSALGAPEPVTNVRAYGVQKLNGVAAVNFTVQAKNSTALSNAAFSTYGISGVITTPLTIIGDQTGLRLDMKVQINQS